MLRTLTIVRSHSLAGDANSERLSVPPAARKLYPSGIKASPEYLKQEPVIRDKILPKFNYRFEPQ